MRKLICVALLIWSGCFDFAALSRSYNADATSIANSAADSAIDAIESSDTTLMNSPVDAISLVRDMTMITDLALPEDMCPSNGVCLPGQQRAVSCGNCGMQINTCATNCQWTTGACANQGSCAPNATQQGNCDVCSEQLCENNCQWGACQLKQGNICHPGNSRPCQVGGVCSSSQTCQNCRWPNYCCG